MSGLKTHLVEVKAPSGRTACKVSRAFVVIKSRDRIKFRNRTTGKVHVQVSDDRLFDNPMFTILPGQEITLATRTLHRGVYPYAVFCEQKARFCTGLSMPIIIVPK